MPLDANKYYKMSFVYICIVAVIIRVITNNAETNKC